VADVRRQLLDAQALVLSGSLELPAPRV